MTSAVTVSAPVEAERTARVLGGATAAPVVSVEGSLYPVAELWTPPPPGVKRSDDRGVTPAFLDRVAVTTRRALAEQDGDVLVFLPGAAEVSGAVRRLAGLEADHEDHSPAERAHVRALAAELGLLVTGSSDFHGTHKTVRLGAHTTDPGAYERIVAAASGVTPVASG